MFGNNRLGLTFTPVVKNLLIINIAVFLIVAIGKNLLGYNLTADLSLFYFQSPFFKPHQLITHMFMHGGIGHIFFNMYALVLFGNMLEREWGGKRFLLYYIATGLGAAFLHTLVNFLHAQVLLQDVTIEQFEYVMRYGANIGKAPIRVSQAMEGLVDIYFAPAVGASGAVFGLLLGYAMLFPHMRMQLIFPPISLTARQMAIGYGALELYLALSMPGSHIAHFAHLGGMVFGYILIKLYKKNQFNNNRWN